MRRSHTWRLLLEPEGAPGAVNMGIDQALLDDAARSGTATLRLYRWDPPCLSFGRNEPAASCYDRAAIERLGIDVVRRPTGGSAVWHDDEVTYAVAAPVEAFGSLRDAYRTIHARLAAALRLLGADVTLAPERSPAFPPDRPTACFAMPVGGEILAQGRKLVGSAQVRQRRALLQHGSILLSGSQDMIRAVSREPFEVGGATSLSAVLGRPVAFDEVERAVVQAWGDSLALATFDRPRPSSTAPSWTWRR